ncbi:hypothetical protein TWF696_007596 [Orbilia brochopaga]|uniref:Uncharacterized protein n=1 Tax=Orbilia brochopaga TaxID=3140254 RepID=A0AAV9UKM4_9PEZI
MRLSARLLDFKMPAVTLSSLKLPLPLRHYNHAQIAAALAVISAVKSQLFFHAKLLQRHSPTLLFLLEHFTPSDNLKRHHWSRFQPYSTHHLQILINVFVGSILDIEQDERVLLAAAQVKQEMLSYIWTDRNVEEVLLRWQVDVRNRWIGRLMLDSYTAEDKSGQRNRYSCRIQEYMEMLALIWHEEVERDYHGVFPEELYPRHGHADSYKNGEEAFYTDEDEVAFSMQANELDDDDDETLKGDEDDGEYRGPSCLKRSDDGTLKYTT